MSFLDLTLGFSMASDARDTALEHRPAKPRGARGANHAIAHNGIPDKLSVSENACFSGAGIAPLRRTLALSAPHPNPLP
jgi:hypothetical protein